MVPVAGMGKGRQKKKKDGTGRLVEDWRMARTGEQSSSSQRRRRRHLVRIESVP